MSSTTSTASPRSENRTAAQDGGSAEQSHLDVQLSEDSHDASDDDSEDDASDDVDLELGAEELKDDVQGDEDEDKHDDLAQRAA